MLKRNLSENKALLKPVLRHNELTIVILNF